MNRRNFFRRLFVGAAAIAVAPKIIEEVTRPETALERGTRIHMELEKYIIGIDTAIMDQMIVYGTICGYSGPDGFKWHEPNYLDRYKFIQAKARRKGFGYRPDQFLPFYEEVGKFPEI